MQSTHIRSLLQELSATLRELHTILSAELPANAPYWERAAKEAEYLATEGTPREAEQFARRIAGAFGVGMGSFGDIYINDRFESLRETLTQQLGRIEDSARNVGGVDRAKIRTLLVELETALLNAGLVEARDVRDVFARDELDYLAVRALLTRLEGNETVWRGRHQQMIRTVTDRIRLALGDEAHEGSSTDP